MRKIRYVRQRDSSSCAPTMIMNVMKWAGLRASWKGDLKRLRDRCHTMKFGINGSRWHFYISTLMEELFTRGIDFHFSDIVDPSVRQITRAIRSGAGVVLHIPHRDGSGHVMFIPSESKCKKKFLIVNGYYEYGDSVTAMVDKDVLRRQFRNCRRFDVPRLATVYIKKDTKQKS